MNPRSLNLELFSSRELRYELNATKSFPTRGQPQTIEFSSEKTLIHLLLEDFSRSYSKEKKKTQVEQDSSLRILELLLREKKSWLQPNSQTAKDLLENMIRQNVSQVNNYALFDHLQLDAFPISDRPEPEPNRY